MNTSSDKSEKKVLTEKNKGGRPKGSLNKMAREAREAAQATGLLPHQILLKMARGELITVRFVQPDGKVVERQECCDMDGMRDAAKSAAPYYAPRLNAIELNKDLTDDELDEFIKRTASEEGIGLGPGGEETPED
jgi:hypothetical protein